MKQYDAIIIGFGKAGKTLAAELSNRGWQVAVVEQSDEMYGGACPNVACIPTKTLIHESEISTLLYHNDFDKQSNMYRQAIARKNKLTSFLRENNYEKLSKRPNVTIYTGKGSLVSANTVKVALPEEEIELQGKEIFIIIISREAAAAEKGRLKYQYERAVRQMNFDRKLCDHHVRVIKATEVAKSAFRKAPSIEAGLRLCQVLDGIQLPPLEDL